MVKNVNECYLKSGETSQNVLFCPQSKCIQFTVTEERRNEEIFTFKKLKSENFDILNLKPSIGHQKLAINLLADNIN